MRRLGDLLGGDASTISSSSSTLALIVLAVAEDPERAGDAAVGLKHDPRQDLLALLEAEPLDVEVGHPDPPGVMVGVLAVVRGHALGEPLEQVGDLARVRHRPGSSYPPTRVR